MARRIILDVAPDGSVVIKTVGYQGPACKAASKFLEDALGDVESETLTSEYHQKSEDRNDLKQGT